ncbi:hypothetical protein F5Y14DRAFT_437913 [Nemania sp. NC0429]|nr:hypothetical protein F5Y14DRAFT_437913 [Nemania sp. NC0429]
MLSTSRRVVSAASAATAAAGLVRVPFSNQPGARLSPDIDGPWPTIQLGYGDSQGNLTLNTYLTFSNVSVLVKPQPCADEVADRMLRCGEFASPEFYQNDSRAKQVALPAMEDFAPWHPTYFGHLTPWDNVSLTGPPGLDVFRFLPFDGNITGIKFTYDLAGHRIETPAIVGERLATLLSNNSRSVPLLNSMISLPEIATSLWEAGKVSSSFSSFHMGSVEPPVSGSLVVSGYDDNKNMGDLLDWTMIYNSLGYPDFDSYDLLLTRIYVGVESGFLPLENLILNNNSFPQGPYKQEPSLLDVAINSTSSAGYIIEPGTPYLHLNYDRCDSLAKLLDLEYDITRNLYLWSYPADHPILRSPVYLEFVFVSSQFGDFDDLDEQMDSVSIKIPMALLQHTFHATTRATNGSLLPSARYFPCSRHRYEPNDGIATWPRLGRAFLQSAFIASHFNYDDPANTLASYWLAQAPGPVGMGGKTAEELIEVASGTIANRTEVILEANAWTKSWSSVLPIWTLDHDGVTTLDQLNAAPETPKEPQNLGAKVAAPIVGAVVALIAILSVRGIHRSHIENTRIKQEMLEEDALARETERLVAARGIAQLITMEQPTELVSRGLTDDGSTNRLSLSVSILGDDESRVSESEHVVSAQGNGTAVSLQSVSIMFRSHWIL